MEAFKAFATLSLVDLLSSPLRAIKAGLAGADAATLGLSQRMGRLALAMAPVAIAAGLIVGSFAACATSAMAFESSMADVAKVIDFDTAEEFTAMGDAVKDLAGRLPMAADGIAAIIAAAGQSGVAKADLVEFAEQAAKMGIAFDLTGDQAGKMMADWRAGMGLSLPQVYGLADAVNHLSNNMNATAPALGELLQRTGALAMQCGLTETQVAALGTAFLSAGASPEVASTALKKFVGVLARGEGLSKRAATAFSDLGLSATQMAKDMQTDAKGTIFKVLEALADKPKELQMSLLTQMFGEEAIGAIAPLLGNMNNLTEAFELVGDAALYAGSMQGEFEARSKTAENALQLMRNRFTNLAISVGTYFLPVISWAADKLGILADCLRAVVDSPLGQWLLGILGALSAAILATTAFSAGMWAFAKLGPTLAKVFAPLKAALLGLGWPMLLLIGAAVALYAAYKNNFGGIADTLDRWYSNVSLVFRGVAAIFKVLTGSSFELRGELAKEIKAAGLEKFVVTAAKVVYRIRAFFTGLWEGIDFARPLAVLAPVGEKLGAIFEKLGALFGRVFGSEITAASAGFAEFGQLAGGVVTFALEALATSVSVLADGLTMAVGMLQWLAAVLSGDWLAACQAGQAVWDAFVSALLSIADLFRVGDWLREAWADAEAYLASIDLFECGAAILETMKQGIMSKWQDLKASVSGAFSEIRNLLPFSDAKEGPLSQLTLSGSKIMSTLAEGVSGGAATLQNSVMGSLQGASQQIGAWWDQLFSDQTLEDLRPEIAPVPAYAGEEKPRPAQDAAYREDQGRRCTIHIGQIVLPNATDAKGFLQSLEDLVSEMGGDYSPA